MHMIADVKRECLDSQKGNTVQDPLSDGLLVWLPVLGKEYSGGALFFAEGS